LRGEIGKEEGTIEGKEGLCEYFSKEVCDGDRASRCWGRGFWNTYETVYEPTFWKE
jgi:hypothetical protein